MAFEFAEQPNRSCKGVAGADLMFLFQPDTILPLQFSDMHRRNVYVQSEKRLMLAVLEDAVGCFQKYHSVQDKNGKKIFQEADEWFRRKGRDWLFSFETICETLAMNPDYLLWGLFEWKERQPLSKRCGQRKGTETSGKKARALRRTEGHRISVSSNHEGDRFETLDTTSSISGPLTSVEVGNCPCRQKGGEKK